MSNNNGNVNSINPGALSSVLMLCAAVLMLSSCVAQKLPSHEAGYGLVAVPYQVRNQTTYQLVKAIELKSTTNNA